MKKRILIYGVLIAFTWLSGKSNYQPTLNTSPGLAKSMTYDVVPDATISWIGEGLFTQYTISNTGQNGVFEPPPGWAGYDGLFPLGYGAFNGRTGEFPKGTNQFYTWGAGLWIGAKSDQFNTPDDRDLVATECGTEVSNARVAYCGYYSEMSAVSKLWQSNQLINAVSDGKSEDYKGQALFGQKNKSVEDYQDVWSYFLPEEGDYFQAPNDTIFRLDYEEINEKRRAFLETAPSLDSSLILLDPFREDDQGNVHGDVVSDEDTYAVFGDYIDERDANFLWTAGYDVRGLGVRVEQRTYSWSTDDYLYINYKITNMNDFPLDSVFVGYFMDNDIGYSDDDLIGFDRNLNLGYSYDSDSEEDGWIESAGYIGSVFVETPVDSVGEPSKGIPPAGNSLNGWEIGLTGFQTWIRSDLGNSECHSGDADDSETDHIKYFQLSMVDSFEVFETPQDVRQLATSGPVISLPSGASISVTVALVAGSSLADLRNNTESAINKFQSGYIGSEAPPSPALSIQPAHQACYLSWNKFPEDVVDPFSGNIDFAGYRVYRSESGLQGDWDMLAEFDIDSDSSAWEGTAFYTKGTSNAEAEFMGPIGSGDISANSEIDEIGDRFVEAVYTVEFVEDQITVGGVDLDTLSMVIYNTTSKSLVHPNIAAMTHGAGFRTYASFDSSSMKAQSGTLTDIDLYRSGYFIYVDGFYFKIENGEYKDMDQDGQISQPEKDQQSLSPRAGDIFEIHSFASKEIGNQRGLTYTYLDENLTDGMTYYYSVTSFDGGQPTNGIPPLESSIYQNMTKVVPQHMPLELAGKPSISDYTHVGPSTSRFQKAITSYQGLKGHSYVVKFFKEDYFSDQFGADYGLLIDSTETPIGVNEALVSLDNSTAYTDTLTVAGLYDSEASEFLPNGHLIPGTVNISVGTVELSDLGNGVLQGISGADTLFGLIHYGKGILIIEDEFTASFTDESSVTAQYQYLPVIVQNSENDTYNGFIRAGNIYSVKTVSTDEEGTVYDDHGFIFRLTNPVMGIDSVYWSLGSNVRDLFRFEVSPDKVEPYDYFITFNDVNDSANAPSSAWAYFKDRIGDDSFYSQKLPVNIYNKSQEKEVTAFNPLRLIENKYLWWILDEDAGANTRNIFKVMTNESLADSSVSPNAFTVQFKPFDENIVGGEVLSVPQSINTLRPDTLFVDTSRPLTDQDVFRFYTVNMLDTVYSATIDDIRVVPNPYIVRARWDENRFNQHLDFRHLPSVCTIRIFNVAGEWIATLVKDGIVGANEIQDTEGTLSWDLRNYEGLKVASGLYIYQVEGELFGKSVEKTGKFAVVVGP